MDFFDKLRKEFTVDDFTGYLGQYFGDEEMTNKEWDKFDVFLMKIYSIGIEDLQEKEVS